MQCPGSPGKHQEDIMRDEIDGRIWAEHHEQFSDSVHKAAEAVRIAFQSLQRIQFDAPWKKSRERC
jgi:hypothetical protein